MGSCRRQNNRLTSDQIVFISEANMAFAFFLFNDILKIIVKDLLMPNNQ